MRVHPCHCSWDRNETRANTYGAKSVFLENRLLDSRLAPYSIRPVFHVYPLIPLRHTLQASKLRNELSEMPDAVSEGMSPVCEVSPVGVDCKSNTSQTGEREKA